MEIENKKYCVIPFTGQKGDVSSLLVTFQFNCFEKYIVWDNKKYKDGFTVVNRPNEDAMKKWMGQAETLRKISTPFLLDTVVNSERFKPENQKPSKNKDSIMENVRLIM